MEHIDYLESGLNDLSRTLTPPSYPAPSPPTSPTPPSKLAPAPPQRKGNASHKLLEFNFAHGLPTPTFVSVDTLKIDVMINLDKAALDNILNDEESLGYTIQTLSSAATEKLQEIRTQIQNVIKKVDAEIVVLVNQAKQDNLPFEEALQIMEQAMAKLKVANEAIPHYCRQAAAAAQQEVSKAYAGLQDRSSKLKWFKIMIGVKLTVYAISAALSITASLLTMGTLSVLTVCSLVKMTADITQMVIDCSTSVKTDESELRGMMTDLTDNIMTQDHGGKSVERFFREALSLVSDFSKNFLSSLGNAEKKLNLFYVKLAKLEASCDLNSKKINELIAKIGEAEEDDKVLALDDKDEKLQKLGELREQLEDLLEKTSAMGGYAKKGVSYADGCKTQLDEWRNRTYNTSTFPTGERAGWAILAGALGSTVKTCVDIGLALA